LLYLPQGGNHAWVKAILCNGWAVGSSLYTPLNPTNFTLDIYIYSSNGYSKIQTSGTSATKYCYHYGQVFCTTRNTGAPQVVIRPSNSDPEKACDIYVKSYIWHGHPLSMGIAGGGGYFNSAVGGYSVSTLPITGYVDLPVSTIITNKIPVSVSV
jgi:hypothetical protein